MEEQLIKIDLSGKYDWKDMSLYEFLEEGNYPSRWIEFFSLSEVQGELRKISEYLSKESNNTIIYPPINHVFRAFYLTDPNTLKAVILGQDPYHNGSAVGLCFSVHPSKTINSSLQNMYTELKREGFNPTENGNLFHWAEQGCLMINTALTVGKAEPESHTEIWSRFSELLIDYISKKKPELIWLLMGGKAYAFREDIQNPRNVIVTSHPSGYSANKRFRQFPAFIGSNIFRIANSLLEKENKKPVKW